MYQLQIGSTYAVFAYQEEQDLMLYNFMFHIARHIID